MGWFPSAFRPDSPPERTRDSTRAIEVFLARLSVIVAESRKARAAIRARHGSADGAGVELDALDEYTSGRIRGAWDDAVGAPYGAGERARFCDPRMDAFLEEFDARRSVISAEARRSARAIWARHDSYESAHVEVLALFEYNRGRLDVAWEDTARKHAMPQRIVALREQMETALRDYSNT